MVYITGKPEESYSNAMLSTFMSCRPKKMEADSSNLFSLSVVRKRHFPPFSQRATDELTKKYTEYQQEQANLPKNIQERRQKELQELQEKGMQFQQDAQQQLQKSYADMMEPIYKKIEDAIKAVGQEGGYTYIFDLNRTEIPYVNEAQSTDVTAAVKAKVGIK
jgi:outer membrane protein